MVELDAAKMYGNFDVFGFLLFLEAEKKSQQQKKHEISPELLKTWKLLVVSKEVFIPLLPNPQKVGSNLAESGYVFLNLKGTLW